MIAVGAIGEPGLHERLVHMGWEWSTHGLPLRGVEVVGSLRSGKWRPGVMRVSEWCGFYLWGIVGHGEGMVGMMSTVMSNLVGPSGGSVLLFGSRSLGGCGSFVD